MANPRRQILGSVAKGALALAATLSVGHAVAQASKPIRLLVGFPPGGGTDATARALADKLTKELGTSVVVENRPGAGGQIAAQALKTAAPDGTTLFLTHDHTISILPLVLANPGYDVATDFTPVAGFASFVNTFAVAGATPARTFNEYLAWVKTQGSKSTVGIPAPASTPEFLVKLVAERYKLDLVPAAYRGGAPLIADMIGNQIPAGIGSVPDFIEYHKAGKLRVVMVLGKNRQPALPDVPSSTEIGLAGLEDLPYYGLYAPAGTPKASIDRIADAVAHVIAQPDLRERFTSMGLAVEFMNPQQLGAREHAYTQAWTRIIRQSGFRPQ